MPDTASSRLPELQEMRGPETLGSVSSTAAKPDATAPAASDGEPTLSAADEAELRDWEEARGRSRSVKDEGNDPEGLLEVSIRDYLLSRPSKAEGTMSSFARSRRTSKYRLRPATKSSTSPSSPPPERPSRSPMRILFSLPLRVLERAELLVGYLSATSLPPGRSSSTPASLRPRRNRK